MAHINIKAALRSDRIKENGDCNIIIRIFIGEKVVHTEKTGKTCRPDQWNQNNREVRGNHENSKLYNLAIRKRISEIEALLLKVEVTGACLTSTLVKRILSGKDIGFDYFNFCMEHIPIKYCEDRQAETRRSYFSELTKLKKFRATLNFNEINNEFLQSYRAYMLMALKNHPNTVWKSFKFMKTMINDAIKAKKITGEHPMRFFESGKYVQGVRKFLELSDCDDILVLLNSPLPDKLKQVGYYYLFMCFSGLRYQDAISFDPGIHLIDNERICMKTKKKGVEINLFMNNRLTAIVNYIIENPLKLSNQKFNKYLKIIAELSGIRVDLTAHVGRHTFGALLAEMETPKEVAQKLLGHNDIRSTNIYYHLKDKSMDKAMKGFDNL